MIVLTHPVHPISPYDHTPIKNNEQLVALHERAKIEYIAAHSNTTAMQNKLKALLENPIVKLTGRPTEVYIYDGLTDVDRNTYLHTKNKPEFQIHRVFLNHIKTHSRVNSWIYKAEELIYVRGTPAYRSNDHLEFDRIKRE